MPRLTGKHALMQQLIANGAHYLFGNPGTTEQPFQDVLQDYPQLKYILALHEGVAVSMADAYARITQTPAFVELHIAPGLGNGLGMMHNARVGQSPLVIYAGQSESRSLLMEPHLSGPLVEMARPICKWAYQVEHAHDVPQALRRAFKVAAEPPQGPVFLALPMDVMDQEADVEIVPAAYTNWRTRPDAAGLAEAADLLLNARSPMILAGDRVALSGAQQALVGIAELLGAPVFELFSSEWNFPASHPLNLGPIPFTGGPKPLKAALASCDVLLAVGSPVFQMIFPTPEPVLPSGAKLIQIDPVSWELNKNIPADVALLADPRAALVELSALIGEGRTPALVQAAEARAAAIGRRTAAARERYREQAQASWDNMPISGARLMSEIAGALPQDGMIFAESITNQAHLRAAVQADEPDRLLHGRGGGIGPGLPGALGAQLARPDRKVVGVCSDGAAMYSITALWTAAHHNIPVTYVMLGNGSYRILKLNMVEYLGSKAKDRKFVELDLNNPPLRFDLLANAMGVPSRRVERPEEIASALREGIAHNGPYLIDVAMEGPVPLPG
ncbi:MAG: thiamine pyrophosphate-binding protein [Dehalococcoidia bacterium]|nr:thiamine pyrophosphate-binding protein [Dehalococcoidia bacterium]